MEIFHKIKYYYLKNFKHEILIFMDQNNLHHFINMKYLSFKQVYQVQKLFQYYIQINYCQDKINKAIDAFSKYFQQNAKEKTTQKSKISSLFIICRLLYLKYLNFQYIASLIFIKSSFMVSLLSLRQINFEAFYKKNWLRKSHILSILKK